MTESSTVPTPPPTDAAAKPAEDEPFDLPLDAEVKSQAPTGPNAPPPSPAQIEADRKQQLLALQQLKLVQAHAAKVRTPAPAPAAAAPQPSRLAALLKRFEGQTVGINYDNSAQIQEADFVDVNPEYFRVFVKAKKLHFTFPLHTLLAVVEGEDGVETVIAEASVKLKAVLKVYPLVLF